MQKKYPRRDTEKTKQPGSCSGREDVFKVLQRQPLQHLNSGTVLLIRIYKDCFGTPRIARPRPPPCPRARLGEATGRLLGKLLYNIINNRLKRFRMQLYFAGICMSIDLIVER